jgi:hypothetical protein
MARKSGGSSCWQETSWGAKVGCASHLHRDKLYLHFGSLTPIRMKVTLGKPILVPLSPNKGKEHLAWQVEEVGLMSDRIVPCSSGQCHREEPPKSARSPSLGAYGPSVYGGLCTRTMPGQKYKRTQGRSEGFHELPVSLIPHPSS